MKAVVICNLILAVIGVNYMRGFFPPLEHRIFYACPPSALESQTNEGRWIGDEFCLKQSILHCLQ